MVANALQPNPPGTSSTSTTASAANTSHSSTLGTQSTAAESQRISDLQEQFQQQAQKDPAGFRLALREAFGDKAGLAQIDQLLDLALAGKLPMPANIQFVESGSLGSNAFGAYDSSNGGSLYLDRSLLSDPAKLQSVFNEEMGHHLDALLGGADAAGDEGAVFSRTLEQGQLSQTELASLKNENDHGVIQLEGRWVQVEFNEEGSDDGGDGGDGSDGGDGGGGGECSVDSGGGNSGGSSESQGGSNTTDDGGTDSGGECSVDGGNEDGGPTEAEEPDEPDTNPNEHANGNSDSDRAGGTQGTGGPQGGDGPQGSDGPQDGDGPQDVDDEVRESRSPVDAEPEPEEKGFWSRALDTVQTGLDFAGFVPGLGAVPDLLNAGISLARGDKRRAAESAVAAIPLGGDAFKAGRMGMRNLDRFGGTRGSKGDLPEIDGTGKLHGELPHIKDLKNLDRGTLEDLRDDLQNSLERRKQVSKDLGPDAAHSRREAAEEDLLKSINKHLGNN